MILDLAMGLVLTAALGLLLALVLEAELDNK